MSFKNTFCPSPWFHMRINNNGTYEYCRWTSKPQARRMNAEHAIQVQPVLEYFRTSMSDVRQQLLNGEQPSGCSDCYQVEKHNKVSGRQRQLLKAGVLTDYFESSLSSSTLRPAFDYSAANHGNTLRSVSDWQVDLGNYCNSACVFCTPHSSSKLAAEFKHIGIIDELPPRAWCDNPALVEQFCQDLAQCENLTYIHFIGGETLITPGFKQILTKLVEADLAKNVTVGFTTNLTVKNDEIVNLLKQFKQVNLGLSIEALDPVNDYARYPSKFETTVNLLDYWVELGQSVGWLIQLRITPTWLTIHALDTVYEYAWQHGLAVESCNFLNEPQELRSTRLPIEFRQQAANRLQAWISSHSVATSEQIINTRNPNHAKTQVVQDAQSYLNYLNVAPDESSLLPQSIDYIKLLERNRNNSILTYLPEYEELLRSAGY